MPLGEGSAASNLVNGGNLTSGIGAGISKAKLLQRKIVDTAMNLVERKAITRLRHFRYAFICCTSQESKDSFLSQQQNGSSENAKEYHVFAQPLALSRLAQWLFDMHRENGKWTGSKNRPLVLCAEKPETKSYLVVGYEFPEQQGQFLKNHFGQHFQMTCDSMQGTFRLDSFDSNVVEVDANDVQRFIEQLHYLMDSM
jgi:cell division control protein 45